MIMEDILSTWGIYPDVISEVVETCESALEKVGYTQFEIDNLHQSAYKNTYKIPLASSITNTILEAYLYRTIIMLEQKGYQASFYVNLDDTHLYINDKEYCAGNPLPAKQEKGSETHKRNNNDYDNEALNHYKAVLHAMFQKVDFEEFSGFYEEGGCEGIIEWFYYKPENDYICALENAFEAEFGVDVYSKMPSSKQWVEFMDKHETFKKSHFHEYEVMQIMASPSLFDAIDAVQMAFDYNKDLEAQQRCDKSTDIERD